MTNDFDVLVDSDAFVGFFLPNDAHFERTTALFSQLRQNEQHLVTTSWVTMETATVLSHREGQGVARHFLAMLQEVQFPVIHISETLQAATVALFIEQSQRGTSMTDCANVEVMRRFGIPAILSFDKVYSKTFHLKMAT